MKSKLSIVIVIFITILLVITASTTVYYYKSNKDLNLELNSLKTKVQEYEAKEELEKADENVEPEEFKNVKLDEDFINNGGVHKYPYDNANGIDVTIKENNELYIRLYGEWYNSDKEPHKVEGIDGQIVEARIVNIGNGSYPTILILMEDGTVEYVKSESYTTDHPVSSGEIEGLNNVVRIIPLNITQDGAGGYSAFAVIKSDGTTQFINHI